MFVKWYAPAYKVLLLEKRDKIDKSLIYMYNRHILQ